MPGHLYASLWRIHSTSAYARVWPVFMRGHVRGKRVSSKAIRLSVARRPTSARSPCNDSCAAMHWLLHQYFTKHTLQHNTCHTQQTTAQLLLNFCAPPTSGEMIKPLICFMYKKTCQKETSRHGVNCIPIAHTLLPSCPTLLRGQYASSELIIRRIYADPPLRRSVSSGSCISC